MMESEKVKCDNCLKYFNYDDMFCEFVSLNLEYEEAMFCSLKCFREFEDLEIMVKNGYFLPLDEEARKRINKYLSYIEEEFDDENHDES